MTTKHSFPDRLKVRDTKVTADEGQRIYSTATGYGYEWCECVRADLASPPSPAPAESGAVATLLTGKADKLLSHGWVPNMVGYTSTPLYTHPSPAPSASMGRVTDDMVEAGCRALAWGSDAAAIYRAMLAAAPSQESEDGR